MKHLSILLLLGLAILVPDAKLHAQIVSNHQKSDKGNKQWISHQMFQPPVDSEKQKIPERVVEEIRKLYLEAEKEIEMKNPSNAKIPKKP